MLCFILVTVLSCYIAIKLYCNFNYWKLRGVIHIKPWPFENFFSIFDGKSFVDSLQEKYLKYPDAKFVGLQQFMQPSLMIKDPELIKQVTVKSFDNFFDHTIFLTEDIAPLFGKNLFSLKGQKWRDMRATLSPAFTSSKMRKMYILIKECAENFTEHFLNLEREKEPLELEMLDIFTRYANDVIATCAFGINLNSLKDGKNEFYTYGKNATTFTFLGSLKFMAYFTMPKVMHTLGIKLFPEAMTDFFLDIVKSTIEMREKNNIIRPDMIHLLMEARKGLLKHELEKDEDAGFATVEESQIGKEQKNTKFILTDEDITAQAIIFFMAGYDTSSTVMHFLAYELALNPDIQKNLQTEIDSTFQKCNGDLDYNSLLKMKYLDMVVSECLRKWPPAIFSDRICTIPYKFIDENQVLLLEKGKSIFIPTRCIHHDEKYFPNPSKFVPERFSDENKSNITPFTYMPFGVGPRNCIGSRFALLEIKTIFVNILYKFDITVTEKTEIPLKLTKFPFSMKTAKGIWLAFKKRS